MNEVTKKEPLGCPQSKGAFEFIGVVTGTERDNFYREGVTGSTGRSYRSVTVGVEISETDTVYCNLFGMEKDSVYFSMRDKTTKKTDVKQVPWNKRFDFNTPGYSMMGVKLGLSKTIDDKGREVNAVKNMTEYDACEMLRDNLKDGQSVYIRGDITYSSYNGEHRANYNIKQVSLCKPINFDDVECPARANFEQGIVLSDVTKDEEHIGEYLILGKCVGYNTIEDVSFSCRDAALVKQIKRSLKPYTGFTLYGSVEVEQHTAPAESDSGEYWGTKNAMKRVTAPTVRRMVVLGVIPETIDTETYNEEIIDRAMSLANSVSRAKNEYADRDVKSGFANDGFKRIADDDEDFDIDL